MTSARVPAVLLGRNHRPEPHPPIAMPCPPPAAVRWPGPCLSSTLANPLPLHTVPASVFHLPGRFEGPHVATMGRGLGAHVAPLCQDWPGLRQGPRLCPSSSWRSFSESHRPPGVSSSSVAPSSPHEGDPARDTSPRCFQVGS